MFWSPSQAGTFIRVLHMWVNKIFFISEEQLNPIGWQHSPQFRLWLFCVIINSSVVTLCRGQLFYCIMTILYCTSIYSFTYPPPYPRCKPLHNLHCFLNLDGSQNMSPWCLLRVLGAALVCWRIVSSFWCSEDHSSTASVYEFWQIPEALWSYFYKFIGKLYIYFKTVNV